MARQFLSVSVTRIENDSLEGKSRELLFKTTDLDAATEHKVVDALEWAAARCTTITITHGLAPMRFADRVLILKDGRIIEERAARNS